MKDDLGEKIITEFVELRGKTYSYLKDNNEEDKKAKDTKKVCYKNCLETAQTKNKLNYSEKNKIYVDSPKEFVKNNKLMLKTQQRFKGERHNVFIEEINKIVLSYDDDKRMHSIDSLEICTRETSKYLVCKKEGIKCKDIIKQYKNI